MTEHRRDWPLVETDWLAAHLEDPAVRVVDVRGSIRPSPIQRTGASPAAFAALMGRLGIGDDHTVVAYDDNAHIAPRLWWVLNYYGHPTVKVLNGGFPRWAAEGRPVTAALPAPPPAPPTT